MFRSTAIAAVLLSAVSSAFAADEAVLANADGNYVAVASVPVGQAQACNNLKDISIKIIGTQITVRNCTSQIEPDGSFHCSVVPRLNTVAEYAGHVAGNTIEGTLWLQVTIPPPALDRGFSCHGTFKASRQ
jgi:hypothetical protein